MFGAVYRMEKENLASLECAPRRSGRSDAIAEALSLSRDDEGSTSNWISSKGESTVVCQWNNDKSLWRPCHQLRAHFILWGMQWLPWGRSLKVRSADLSMSTIGALSSNLLIFSRYTVCVSICLRFSSHFF